MPRIHNGSHRRQSLHCLFLFTVIEQNHPVDIVIGRRIAVFQEDRRAIDELVVIDKIPVGAVIQMKYELRILFPSCTTEIP